ncbi:outer membrane beta-barrel protein [Coxiella endosymbiont of Ornithodoros maritimus]|uniref:outer membrane beta-barrel protein n=1 Tax=Coxiella endosymbiont of Ornithodoros maritimus TaxID=1656172 RepID=UPI0022645ABA|nr:outer membrane beta-barrel protein [Coxiella endosymbiont of Ornithodoros maritimus]
MSVKKLVTLATLSMASVGVTSAALAGGPDYVPASSYAGVYLEGNLGYAYRPWRRDASTVVGILKQLELLGSSSRGNGGFTFAADLGYQFNQYFTVEGGWFYLPKMKFTTTSTSTGVVDNLPTGTYTVKSGMAYATLKGIVPVYENTYVFGKLGVAYIYNQADVGLPTNKIPAAFVSRSRFWNPLFAAGVQYCFTPNWSVNTQYTFVPGYRNASSKRFVAPVTHLFTVGLGYKFLM